MTDQNFTILQLEAVFFSEISDRHQEPYIQSPKTVLFCCKLFTTLKYSREEEKCFTVFFPIL